MSSPDLIGESHHKESRISIEILGSSPRMTQGLGNSRIHRLKFKIPTLNSRISKREQNSRIPTPNSKIP